MDESFLAEFKARTEASWSSRQSAPTFYTFQIAPGTKWLPGLSTAEIDGYERAVGARFPDEFRFFLGRMNGTDKDAVSLSGPHRTRPAVYSYPRDLVLIKHLMETWSGDWMGIREELLDQGITVAPSDRCVPIYAHRGVLCTSNPRKCRVLSIKETDATVYGEDMASYLKEEFAF